MAQIVRVKRRTSVPVASAGFAFVLGVVAVPLAHAAELPTANASECDRANLLAGRAPSAVAEVSGDARLVTDGIVAPEGDVWDAPAAVKLASGSASITYDLGRPRKLSAIYLQADANDTYKITGSLDGQPGSFRALTEISNVVEHGPGLRARAVHIEPATVRYLRVGDAVGDGFYSVSELAAYCVAPAPFPPAMLTAMDAPPAPTPKPPAQPEAAPPAKSPLGWFDVALVAALVSIVGANCPPQKKCASDIKQRGPPVSISARALRGQRLRGADLRDRLVPDVATRAGVVGGVDRRAARNLHGRDVPRQPGACALRFSPSASAARLRHARNRGRRLRNSDAGGDAAGRVRLHGSRRARHPGAASARPVRGDLSFAADGDDGGDLARGFALGGNESARRLVARLLVWRQYLGRGPRLSARGFLSASRIRHAHGDLRRGRPERRGRHWRVRARARSSRGRAARRNRRHRAGRARGSGDTRVDRLRRHRAFGRKRARRRGDLDAAIRTAAQPHHVHLLDYPGRVLDRHRAWQRRRIVRGTADAQCATRARLRPARVDRGYRLDVVEHHELAALLARQSAPGGRPVASNSRSISSAACGQSCPRPACGAPAFRWPWRRSRAKGADGAVVVGRVYAANTVGAIVGALGTSLVLIAAVGYPRQRADSDGDLGARRRDYLASRAYARSAVSAVHDARRRLGLGHRRSAPSSSAAMSSRFPRCSSDTAAFRRAERKTRETFLFVGEGMNSSPAVSRDVNGTLSYYNAGKIQASSLPQDMRLQRMLGHFTTLIPEQPRNVLVIACGAGVTAGAASIDPRVERLTIAEIEPLVPSVVAPYFGDHNDNVVRNPKVHVEVDDARHFLTTTERSSTPSRRILSIRGSKAPPIFIRANSGSSRNGTSIRAAS